MKIEINSNLYRTTKFQNKVKLREIQDFIERKYDRKIGISNIIKTLDGNNFSYSTNYMVSSALGLDISDIYKVID